MPKFAKVSKEIGKARASVSPTLPHIKTKDVKLVLGQLRASQRGMAKPDRIRHDSVSSMKGDKYGQTYNRRCGVRFTVGERCPVCQEDHSYGTHLKWWHGMMD